MVRLPGKLNAAYNRINICDLLVTTQRMLVSAINIMHLDGPLKFVWIRDWSDVWGATRPA